jgi:iron(III) transport system permease protein
MAIKMPRLQKDPFAIITGIAFIFVVIFLYQFIPPLLQTPGPMWELMQAYWFPEVLIQTFVLVVGTVVISLGIGVSLGYWMSFYRVKWARFWDILLVLPLAMPAYLLAYIYVDLTSSTFFQSQLVITNLFGAIMLFSLTLYPYIYLATRSFLSKQPQTMYAAAQSLGSNQQRIFWRIVLPLLRPVLVGASVLVIMEVLNDYGLVQYFGLRVYATTIFQSWFNGNDLNTAVRFSVQLIVFIFVILWIESRLRQSFKYSYTTTQIKPLMKRELTGRSKIAFYTVAILVLSFALMIPVVQLILWLPSVPSSIYGNAFIDGTISSILMAFYPTVIILGIALAVINFQRIFSKPWKKTISRVLTIGYSLPGAVIAVGMILMVIPFDRWLTETFGLDRLLISGSLLLLTFALVLRFLAVASHLIEGTYHKIGMKYTNASYALGRKHLKTLLAVDLPLISHGVIAAGLIVMVDLLKELPLTLILRPFNLQTLATYLFQFAGDEQINLASPMALMLVLLTGLAVAFASDMMLKVNTYES